MESVIFKYGPSDTISPQQGRLSNSDGQVKSNLQPPWVRFLLVAQEAAVQYAAALPPGRTRPRTPVGRHNAENAETTIVWTPHFIIFHPTLTKLFGIPKDLYSVSGWKTNSTKRCEHSNGTSQPVLDHLIETAPAKWAVPYILGCNQTQPSPTKPNDHKL